MNITNFIKIISSRKRLIVKSNHDNVNAYNHSPVHPGSYALRDLPTVPAVYEEPVQTRITPNHVVPQEYETAFSNAHVYSTVETASQEAQDYLSANTTTTYTSLNPLTINQEQNTYSSLNNEQTATEKFTPVGQKSTQQEPTYFTLQNENAVN